MQRSFGPSLDPKAADQVLDDIYRLLADQAQERPAVLILDEFQAMTRHGAHLLDLFKALADEHPDVVMGRFRPPLWSTTSSGGLRPIVALAGPVPNDIQRLAFEAFGLVASSVEEDDIDAAVETAVSHEADQYAERFAA